jgi:hypothetical protein
MPTQSDITALTSGEALSDSGFEDEQPELDFIAGDQPQTEEPVQ